MTPATSHDRQQDQAYPLPNVVTRRKSFGRTFQVGDKIEAEDSQKKWYPARVLRVDEEDSCVLIHFEGFSARYDEWIEMASPKLRVPVRRGRDKTTVQHLRIGEAVLARWTDGKFYPARITEISEESYRVEFYDGYSRTLSPNHIRPVDNSVRSRPQSRSSSGKSSGETVNTPVTVGKQLVNSRRRSRNSSAVSSAASTPGNSYPVSPTNNGDHTPTNGHSQLAINHQSLTLSAKVSFISERSPTDLTFCLPAADRCGMSSSFRADNDNHGNGVVRHFVNGGGVSAGDASEAAEAASSTTSEEGRSDPADSSSATDHSGGLLNTHAVVTPEPGQIIPVRAQSPDSSTSSRTSPNKPVQNGFHVEPQPSSTTTATTAKLSSEASPASSPLEMCQFDPPVSVTKKHEQCDAAQGCGVIMPPSQPNFTPLSPSSSPQRSQVPSAVPQSTSMSPLAASTASASLTSSVAPPPGLAGVTSPACSLAACPSPTSDGVVSSESNSEPNVCKISSSVVSPTSSAPMSVVTPNASPVIPSTVGVATSADAVSLLTGQQTSSAATEDVSQATVSEERHEQAPAPVTQSSRRRTDSETSNSGRPKRKKVDGVLAPPPAKIAPKEVIAVQDHNPYKCKVCDKTFRKWPLLESHYKHYHPENHRDLSQARREYEKRPPMSAVVPNDAEQLLKLAQRKRSGSGGKSSAASATSTSSSVSEDQPGASVTRQRSQSLGKRKEQPGPVVLRQSSAPASLVGSAVNSPLTPSIGVPVLSSSLSSPAGDSAAHAAGASLPARTKRKASGLDGMPAKRGRPPSSSSLSVENTPRLPVVLGKSAPPVSGSSEKTSSKSSRDVPVRLPKSSRRSLSFSPDIMRADAGQEMDSPMVKTDSGYMDLPPDAVLCCPCRQETLRAVLVRCTGCRTYQHFMCVPASSFQHTWSRYQCRACTHPSGKRKGARDKLPSDWYIAQSVCRNPASVLVAHNVTFPTTETRPIGSDPSGPHEEAMETSYSPATEPLVVDNERECRLAAKLVDLQHAASQDILAVGEVLSATMKQLEVITFPDKPSNRAAINRLLPPRVKADSSLVSPIRIKTEQIGGAGIKHAAQTPPFPGRDLAKEAKAMKASNLAMTGHMRSPAISPEHSDTGSPASFQPLGTFATSLSSRPPSESPKLSGMSSLRSSLQSSPTMRDRPLPASVLPNIQQLVDGPGSSQLSSASPPVTTTRPLSPTLVSGSSVLVSPQSGVSSCSLPSSLAPSAVESPISMPHGFPGSLQQGELLQRPASLPTSLSASVNQQLQRHQQQQRSLTSSPVVTAGSPLSLQATLTLAKAAESIDSHHVLQRQQQQQKFAYPPSTLVQSAEAMSVSDVRTFSPIPRSSSGTSLQLASGGSGRVGNANAGARSSVHQKTASLSADVKVKRSVSVESEEEKNFRVQTARCEMLSRVREIHASVGNRLTLLEELVSDLESMEENFRSGGSLTDDMAKPQQLALFQNLFHAVDELERSAAP